MPKEQRLVFGEVAELYDQARPTYPAALIDHLVALLDAGGRVLDVGCGTGKATFLLAARRLVGVGLEPDPEMARVARRNLAPFPQWSVVSGEFENFLADAEEKDTEDGFALITCAQAWHWLDPARRFQHAAHLLPPGGHLALFWNRTADDPSPLRRDVDAVYTDEFPGLSPHSTLTVGRPPVGTPPPDAGFGPPSWQVFPWTRRYTTREWTDQVQTHSDHRMLEPARRALLIARLTEVIDAYGGVFDHPYDCWLWTAARL
jgi:SAM-dependent methyltransferase